MGHRYEQVECGKQLVGLVEVGGPANRSLPLPDAVLWSELERLTRLDPLAGLQSPVALIEEEN